MKIIQSKDSVYNKKSILEYIDKTWLKEPRIYLYSQLKEHDRALKELFKGTDLKQAFKEIEDYCQKNNVMPVNSQIAIRIDNKNSNNMKNNK